MVRSAINHFEVVVDKGVSGFASMSRSMPLSQGSGEFSSPALPGECDEHQYRTASD
jgi:hypothetical protein